MSKHMDVKIVAHRDTSVRPGGIRFEMFYPADGAKDVDKLVCDKAASNMGKHDHHTVVFELENQNGADLHFLKDKDEVMWTAAGDEETAPDCPKRRGCDADFEVRDISNFELKVRNKNMRICKHKFALNFIGTDAQGKVTLIQYDPIFDNRNGSAR